MKTLVGLLLVTLFAHSSWACEPAEAQFMGEITEYKISFDDAGEMKCTVRIGNFTHFTESGVCPLSQPDVESMDLPYPSCNVQGRKKVSGYISVFNDGRIDW